MSLNGFLLKPFLRPLLASRFNPKHSLTSQRKHFERLGGLMLSPSGVSKASVAMENCSALQISPKTTSQNTQSARAMLYLHGGAYIIGSASAYKALAGRYAKALDCTVLVPDYRLAPENPFPAALDDAYDAWQYLLVQGYAPQNIVIAGDSAGGGLSTALCLKLRDRAEALPSAQLLISTWLDLDCCGDSFVDRAAKDRVLSADWVKMGREAYADGFDYRLPYISPLYAELHDLMPILIQVGSDEMLFDDSRRFTKWAKKAGVEIEMQEWQGMWHDWHLFAPFIPEANKAIADGASWLTSKLASN
jgi:acetyl esterase/lipase